MQKKNATPFAQIPNSVITANIPDALFRLLAYCYSNQATFRYNVPQISAVLRTRTRSAQRLIKTLCDAGVFLETTPQQVPYGSIPNFLFQVGTVEAFIKNQNSAAITQQAASIQTPVTEQAASQVASQVASLVASNGKTNNTKKQEEETKTLTLHSEGKSNAKVEGGLEKVVIGSLGSLQLAEGIPSVVEYNKETGLVGSTGNPQPPVSVSDSGNIQGSSPSVSQGMVRAALQMPRHAVAPRSVTQSTPAPRSVTFVPNCDKMESFTLKGAPLTHCWKRTKKIVDQLNSSYDFNFVLDDGAKGTDFWGYTAMAYDPDAKVILTIGEDVTWAGTKHTQGLCEKAEKEGWHVYLYVAEGNVGMPMVHQ